MDTTLRWYATLVHSKHKRQFGEDWADCETFPCYQLQGAVLKGIPEPYVDDPVEDWTPGR